MLLVDGLYINSGGGLILLDYLVHSLRQKKVKFHLLCDARCKSTFSCYYNKTVMEASFTARYHFYQKHKKDYSKVLCFANIPVPIKLEIPVYTYFHNINLLTLNQTTGVKDYVKSWLKRQIFRTLKAHTDLWIVQTANTKKELVDRLSERGDRVLILPYYNIPNELGLLKNKQRGEDFVFVGNYYQGAKGHDELIDAWEILHKKGIDRLLHLTIDKSNKAICNRIDELRKNGVKIVNHGTIPFIDVKTLYEQSKAIIYPSHNESLGLGIIEAICAGRDVIGADLPYMHAICKPSIVFSPHSGESIANAVETYEKEKVPNTKLLIHNHLDEFVELLKY